jgi:RecA/RadA recombinase
LILFSFSIISLDKLLDAGLYTGEVTEIVGGPGSGKTQVHVKPAGRKIGRGGWIALDPWGAPVSLWDQRSENMRSGLGLGLFV